MPTFQISIKEIIILNQAIQRDAVYMACMGLGFETAHFINVNNSFFNGILGKRATYHLMVNDNLKSKN